MAKKIEEIMDKIEATKEVLSTMPKNNLKNINVYEKKIEELKEEYEEYKKDVSNRLQKRYKNMQKKQSDKEIENIEKRLKTIDYILQLLDEEKTSYEKMELDKTIYTISKYYKENLENINEQIKICLNKFSKVGILLTLDDFDYSIYVKNYMKIFFQEFEKGNVNSDKMKQSFEEIYWKSPDIIVQIELNLRKIYLKKQVLIDKYFEKEKTEKLKRLDVTSKEIHKTYNELKKALIQKIEIEPCLLQEKFLIGKLNAKNFYKDKIETSVQKILLNSPETDIYADEETQNNVNKFLNSLYEYQNYIKFKFIIDDIKQYYKEKDKYKKSYLITKKEIQKLEKKLSKLNKKITKRGLFGFKEVEYRQTPETKELIVSIKEKYKELDMNKFYNKIYTELNDKSTLYDVLKLANSYYVYLTSCIIKNFKNIPQDEIDNKIGELNDFLNNPFNTIINHTLITEENDFSIIIKDRYKLLKFNVEKDDLNTNNISSLISKLENIQIAINLKKANIKIEEIEQLCEIKKMLQL